MKREQLKSLITVGFFMLVTGVAMGSLNQDKPIETPQPPDVVMNGDIVTLSGRLIQDKIFSGGDGTVTLSLTMHAADVLASDHGEEQYVDMVIVLDQSGSMSGQKIDYARQALRNLVSSLSARDRVALIGYADRVWKYTELTDVTDTTRERLHTIISNLSAGGNTNLGAGLQEGIATLLANRKDGNLGKVILISDGLANRGITHPDALGKIASLAPEEACMVSTVGVGNDFNPQLMATIANRGAGNFYYLEDAQSFAEFFNKEFHYSRTVAAYGIEIKVPLSKDVSLLKAAGYPITISKDYAIFRPGDLLTGETRKLFLTFKLPTDSEETYELSGITARYLHQGCPYMATLTETFQIAYVNDPNEALVSIAPREWEEKVFRDDFSVLQENVAMSLRNRDQEGALQQIDQYYAQQQLLNARIGSAKVATHLNEELDNLRDQVRQTFRGSPQEVEEQLKQADIMYINGSFQAPRAIMRK